MTALVDRAPALLGWGLGWLGVLAVVGWVLRSRWRSASLVGHVAGAVPVAVGLSGALRGALGLGDLLDAALLSVALHGLVAVVAGRIAGALLGAADSHDVADAPGGGEVRAFQRGDVPVRSAGSISREPGAPKDDP